MRRFCFTIFFTVILVSKLSFSNSISGLELKILINNWLIKKGSVANVELLDEIKYPKCNEKSFFINDISGEFKLIKVSCVSPHEWSFISRNKGIIQKVRNKKNQKNRSLVFALNKSKKNGEIINSDDIIQINRKITNGNGLILNKDDLIGKRLGKSISANRPLFFSNLAKDWVIEKHSLIMIEKKINSITVKTEGIALENGDLGEKIRVKNVKSGKVLQGFVKNEKKVSLNTKQF